MKPYNVTLTWSGRTSSLCYCCRIS